MGMAKYGNGKSFLRETEWEHRKTLSHFLLHKATPHLCCCCCFSLIQKKEKRLLWHLDLQCDGQSTELMPKKFWVRETSTNNMTWGKFTSLHPQFLSPQNGGDNTYLLASSMIHKWMLSKYYSNMEVRVQIRYMWKICWCGHIMSRESPTSTTDPNWWSSVDCPTPIQPYTIYISDVYRRLILM